MPKDRQQNQPAQPLTVSWILEPVIQTVASVKKLMAIVEFFVGSHKLNGFQVQFYLDSKPLEAPLSPDLTGRVQLISDGNLPPGIYELKAEILGRNGYYSKPLTIPESPAAVSQRHKPSLLLQLGEADLQEGKFTVPIIVTAVHEDQPIPNLKVTFDDGVSPSFAKTTNSRGMIQALQSGLEAGLFQLTITADLQVEAVTYHLVDSKVTKLVMPTVKVFEVNVSTPSFKEPGLYSLRAVAEDENHQPLANALISITGGKEPLDVYTNWHGFVDFTVACHQDVEVTKISVDALGARKSKRFDLHWVPKKPDEPQVVSLDEVKKMSRREKFKLGRDIAARRKRIGDNSGGSHE